MFFNEDDQATDGSEATTADETPATEMPAEEAHQDGEAAPEVTAE